MSILLHVCCGPCLLYPARVLAGEGSEFTCYFHNPNIHPYREFRKRLDTFLELARTRCYPYILDRDYGLQEFLRLVVFKEKRRCRLCYHSRLERTAELAAARGHQAFSTTLLYSTYQDHTQIQTEARTAAERFAVAFVYRDFRVGWRQGIAEAKALELYRQSYCGCIYSEQERYDKSLKKNNKKENDSDVQPPGPGHDQPQ